MISVATARGLARAGLAWTPAPGDRFVIPDRGMDDEVFVISTMTVELHDLPDGAVLGFNGTVEWALDSVAKDDALWLPREDQLRTLLAGTFRSLERRAPDRPPAAASDATARPDAGTAPPDTAAGPADPGGGSADAGNGAVPYRLTVAVNGVERAFEAGDAEEVYASALLFLITGTGGRPVPRPG